MEQRDRTATLDAFRRGDISLLAASDVAARGLDIPDVSHIFNFDVPITPEDYVHRIGRTGRAGKEGYAATLVTASDLEAVRAIEKLCREKIEWLGGEPSQEDIEEGRRAGALARRAGTVFGRAAGPPRAGAARSRTAPEASGQDEKKTRGARAAPATSPRGRTPWRWRRTRRKVQDAAAAKATASAKAGCNRAGRTRKPPSAVAAAPAGRAMAIGAKLTAARGSRRSSSRTRRRRPSHDRHERVQTRARP